MKTKKQYQMRDQTVSPETHFRFRGYQQRGNIREFSFEDVSQGHSTHRVSLNADTTLLTKYRLHLQDAPQLCIKIIALSSAIVANDGSEQLNITISEAELSPWAPKDKAKPRPRSKKAP